MMATKQNPISEQRTATVSTRVTEDEYKELEALAQARKQTMSEWAREVLLNQRSEPAGQTVVLAEVMALRAIMVNLAIAQARGETLDKERVRELIQFADVERFRRANEKWIEAANHWARTRAKSEATANPVNHAAQAPAHDEAEAARDQLLEALSAEAAEEDAKD